MADRKAGAGSMPVLFVICVVTFLDQLAKTLVSLHLAHHETVRVIPGFFNLAHVHNTGAAFSIFHDSNTPLAVFSVIVLASLVVFRKRFLYGTPLCGFAVALVAAGIIGNLLDRLKFASVVDLFDFYFRGHHFPTFNIADSSICIGVAIYVLSSFFERGGTAATGDDGNAGTRKESHELQSAAVAGQ